MNICIIGDGLTCLSLAKILINKKINVHVFHKKLNNNQLKNRTIGISKNNFEFFEKEISQIEKKNIWAIKKIEIFSEKSTIDKILDFKNKKNNLFYMIKNNELYKSLRSKLLKNSFFKEKIIKNKNLYKELLETDNYDLIINCDGDNILSKKYFIKKINKDYKNLAYTTILKHNKLENDMAIQIFTKLGPIAYLPISNTETSVVYSIDIQNKNYNNNEILKLIKKYNPKFKIKKISKLSSFNLKSSNLRTYYYKNILSFGDMLHKIHPLAGQGFNMTIRDIKIFSEIIQGRIDLGLHLDSSISEEFEKKTKHKNFIFSNGVDSIYELFNFNRKNKDKNLNQILKLLGANKKFINFLIKFADKGINL